MTHQQQAELREEILNFTKRHPSLTHHAVASEFDVSRPYVSAIMEKAGLLRNPKRDKATLKARQEAVLADLDLSKGLLFKEVAAIHGIHIETVKDIARRCGIRRNGWELVSRHRKRNYTPEQENRVVTLLKTRKFTQKQIVAMTGVGRRTLDTITHNHGLQRVGGMRWHSFAQIAPQSTTGQSGLPNQPPVAVGAQEPPQCLSTTPRRGFIARLVDLFMAKEAVGCRE